VQKKRVIKQKSVSPSPAPVDIHFAFPESPDRAMKLLLQRKRSHHYSDSESI